MKGAVRNLIIALFFIINNAFSQKTYVLNIIVDGSYKGTNASIDSVIKNVNTFFEEFNINFKVNSYLRTNILSKDKTLNNTIEKFCNCGQTADITIGVLGEHAGSEIGLAYRASIETFYSRVVIDLNNLSNDRKVFVLAHEICHVFGLYHSNDEMNLMHDITYYGNLTDQQKYLIQFYSIPEN